MRLRSNRNGAALLFVVCGGAVIAKVRNPAVRLAMTPLATGRIAFLLLRVTARRRVPNQDNGRPDWARR